MTRKRLILILIIVIAAVWIGSAILAFGVLRARKAQQPPVTPPSLNMTTQPPESTTSSFSFDDSPFSSTAPAATTGSPYGTTENPYGTTGSPYATTGSGSIENPFSAAPTSAPATSAGPVVPTGKAAVAAAYVNAVNTLKNTPDFSLVKTEKLNVAIDEISPSSIRSMADKIIQSNQKTAPESYRFSGGTDAKSGLSPNNVIAPIGRQATLNESDVQSATATPTAGGGYTMHLVFGSDVQTLETPARSYSGVFQTVNKETMGLPSAAKVDSFTVNYGGASIDATVDSSGRLVNMTHRTTVASSEGHGSLVMSVTTRMHGDYTGTYDISY